MEQMPHHREGIQNDLDKAYDEGHRDNKAFDEAQVKSEGEFVISEEETQSKLSVDEKAMVAGQEKEISPELAETLARLKEAGYLDTSFEGEEVHELVVRALSKEEAFAEYKKSGVGARIYWKLGDNMPYTAPEAKTLDVMMMNFHKNIYLDKAIAEMDALGVRPLAYEELIQYGTAHPSFQERSTLAAVGSKHLLDGNLCVPILRVDDDGEHVLRDSRWDGVWGIIGDYCFPVVLK